MARGLSNYRLRLTCCLIAFAMAMLSCVLLTSAEVSAATPQKVLLLNSYHHGYKWTDDETKGIMAALDVRSGNTEVYIEYMGAKWISTGTYLGQLASLYRTKFSNVRFDVIIATDDDAFDFLVRYRARVFGNVPVVFCGLNWFSASRAAGFRNYTGINEDADIRANIDLMLKLHPDTSRIYFVADRTRTGRIVIETIRETAAAYRDRVEFVILEDMPMNRLLLEIGRLPDNSLLLLTVFQRDAAGAFFEYNDSTSLISKNSRVPVYGLWDFNLGLGIVGGLLTNGEFQGTAAGELARRILAGESADSIPVVMHSPAVYMFDNRQLERFGISTASLPEGSIIINRQETFYQLNKGLVWGLLSGIVLLAALVIGLLINIRERHEAELHLREEIEVRKRTELELQAARDGLELRVMERTADLGAANQKLILEIAERKKAQERMREISEKDALTRLYNRRRLLEVLKTETGKARRYDRELSLIMLDIDHFKAVNDNYGHQVGDMVLRDCAQLIRRVIRDVDICARYGGEEFIIVAPETGLKGVVALAEKVRSAMEKKLFHSVGHVTISAGVTRFVEGDTLDALIRRADDALYTAKKKGRNRVEVVVAAK